MQTEPNVTGEHTIDHDHVVIEPLPDIQQIRILKDDSSKKIIPQDFNVLVNKGILCNYATCPGMLFKRICKHLVHCKLSNIIIKFRCFARL